MPAPTGRLLPLALATAMLATGGIALARGAQPLLAKKSPAAAVPAPPPIAGPTAEKLLSFYQTEEFLGTMFDQLNKLLTADKRESPLTSAQITQTSNLARRIYRKHNLFDVFRAAYARTSAAETIASHFKWMQTPPGIKLGQGYAQAYLTTPAEWQTTYERTASKSMNPNRRNALDTFISSTQQEELYCSTMVGLDLALQLVYNTFQTPEMRETLAAIKSKIKFKHDVFFKDARIRYRIFDFTLLKNLKNQDVDDVSKYSSTVGAQEMAKGYRRALELTLESAANTLQNEIAKTIK